MGSQGASQLNTLVIASRHFRTAYISLHSGFMALFKYNAAMGFIHLPKLAKHLADYKHNNKCVHLNLRAANSCLSVCSGFYLCVSYPQFFVLESGFCSQGGIRYIMINHSWRGGDVYFFWFYP